MHHYVTLSKCIVQLGVCALSNLQEHCTKEIGGKLKKLCNKKRPKTKVVVVNQMPYSPASSSCDLRLFGRQEHAISKEI